MKRAKTVTPPPPAAPRIPGKCSFASAVERTVYYTQADIDAFAKSKAEFVEKFQADPINALEWRGENIIASQHCATLALHIQHDICYIALKAGLSLEGRMPIPPGDTVKALADGPLRTEKQATQEELEAIAKAIVEALREEMKRYQSEVLSLAKYPPRSTSLIGNIAEQHKLAQMAKLIETYGDLERIINVFENVYIAR